jgi:hypothetical protein
MITLFAGPVRIELMHQGPQLVSEIANVSMILVQQEV